MKSLFKSYPIQSHNIPSNPTIISTFIIIYIISIQLQNENKKWEQFLQHPERYFPQQKQLPFNTAYCDEVLVNHLRRRPDLLKEIIQVQL